MKEVSDEKIKDLHSFALRLAFENNIPRARSDGSVKGTGTILEDINFLKSFVNQEKYKSFMRYLKKEAPELAKDIEERQAKDKTLARGFLTHEVTI
ncbi:MAG: hypothetical protein NT118_11705 [Lentisphaerae bacterium]|nr:hypothetical protein [Lentisphaerota bacterium]